MAFKEAKQIIETKLDKKVKESPEGLARQVMLKASYEVTKDKLSKAVNKTSTFIDKVNYKGNQADKRDYITEVKSAMKPLLADDKVVLDEFLTFQSKIHTKTDNLKERLINQQRAKEELEFQKIKKECEKDIFKADFVRARDRLVYLERRLSPVNTTKGFEIGGFGDVGEKHLRLDLRIKQEIAAVGILEAKYKQSFSEGCEYLGPSSKNYTVKANKDGMISYYSITGIKFDEDDPNKTTPRYQYTKIKKMHWVQFKKLMAKEHCSLSESDSVRLGKELNTGQIHSGMDPEPKLVFEGRKAKGINIPKYLLKEKAQIQEIQKLKELARIYSGETLKYMKDPGKREMLKTAIEESYQSMRLYFQKDANGIAKPTDVYSMAPPVQRMKIIGLAIKNVHNSLEKQGLTKELAKLPESAVDRKTFIEAELAFKQNDTYQAYAKYKKFLSNKGNEKSKEITHAKNRIRECSYYFINLAEKVIAAAIQTKSMAVFSYTRNTAFKKTSKALNLMRQALKAGKAYDLGGAYARAGRPFENHPSTVKLGLRETKIIATYMPFIFKLQDTALMDKPENQRAELLKHAEIARDSGFKKVANVLYKEAMLRKMKTFIDGKKKTDSYWVNKRKEFKRLAYNQGDEKAWKEISKIKDQAEKLAKKSAGKGYAKMPQADKDALIEKYRFMLTEAAGEKNTGKLYFNKFLAANKGDEAASKYIDMNDPFDEWFNLSDEGMDTVKELAGEAIILGCSGGIGNLIGKGVRAGIMLAAKRAAKKTIMKLISSGVGIATDLVASEAIDRVMRTVLQGQTGLFSKKELKNFIKHSLATYGVLRGGAAAHGKMVSKLMKVKGLQKHAGLVKFGASVSSAFGVEAPCMGTLNWGFSGFKGSWSDSYGQALMTVMASRAGMKLFHGAAGGRLLTLERKLDVKAELSSIKAKDPAKAALLERMLASREVPLENVEEMLRTDMSTKQIKAYHDYLNNAENAGFLMKFKLAEKEGRMTDDLRKQFDQEMKELVAAGFSKSQAKKLAKSITLEDLVRKYGHEQRSDVTIELKSAMREQSMRNAKETLTTNLDKIKTTLGRLNVRNAFAVYMIKYGGNFDAYAKDHPKMAKLIENLPLLLGLGALGAVGLSMISAGTGINFDISSLKSALGATAGIGLMGLMQYKPVHETQNIDIYVGKKYVIEFTDGSHQVVELGKIDPKFGHIHLTLPDGRPYIVSNSNGTARQKLKNMILAEYKHTDPAEIREKNSLADQLRKHGFHREAAELVGGDNTSKLSTGHNVRSITEMREAVRELVDFGKALKNLESVGLHDVARELKNGAKELPYFELKLPDFGVRLGAAKGIYESHLKLDAARKQIEFLAPHFKDLATELTNYKGDTYKTFDQRFDRVEELLKHAAKYQKLNITLEEGQSLRKALHQGDTRDLVAELAKNFGGSHKGFKGKLLKLWRTFVAKIRNEAPNITQKQAEKIAVREIQQVKPGFETLDTELSMGILNNAEIHGGEYMGKRLTRYELLQNGLGPQYRIETPDGGSYWASKPYDAGGRPAYVMYVQSEGGIVARTYYMSNSHALWKFLPNYDTNADGRIAHYGKYHDRYTLGREDAISAPFEVQKALDDIYKHHGYKGIDVPNWEKSFAGTARKYTADSLDRQNHTIFREVGVHPEYEPGNLSHPENRLKHGVKDSRSEGVRKVRPETVDLHDPQSKPNFSRVVDSYDAYSPIYGNYKIEVFESHNGKLRFMMGMIPGDNPKAWCKAIEVNSPLSSVGLRKGWIDGGDLTTPIYDYTGQDGSYGNPTTPRKGGGSYIDMSNYTHKIPIVKEYLGAKGIRPRTGIDRSKIAVADVNTRIEYDGNRVTIDTRQNQGIEVKFGDTTLHIRPHPEYGFMIVNPYNPRQEFKALRNKEVTQFGNESNYDRFNLDSSSQINVTIRRDGDFITVIHSNRTLGSSTSVRTLH
ncbi:hypothetical protein ACFL3T_02660 [Patescibacteria group bacterium]